MIRTVLIAAATAAGLMLGACAPLPPAPSEERSPAPAPRPSEAEQPDTSPERPPPATESETERKPVPAAQSLLDRGWDEYRQGNYQGALGLAERAQRIDARSPEVYLLMARAQFSLYRLNLAEQLVRRGLAFSSPGSAVNRQLRSLMSEIAATPKPQ